MVIVVIRDEHVGTNIAQDASGRLEGDNRESYLSESGYDYMPREMA